MKNIFNKRLIDYIIEEIKKNDEFKILILMVKIIVKL